MRYPVALTLVLGASSAHADTAAPRFAVFAVDADADVTGRPVSAAAVVRAVLAEQGAAVLTIEQTRDRLAQPRSVKGYDLAALQKRVDAAEAANAALDPGGSVKILDSVVTDLARDPDFTQAKQKLLEDARLRLATRLVAIAGAKETGGAETEEGARAVTVLLDAVRANPTLTLDEARFPPKMRKLLGRASDQLKKAGLGPLTVTSKPAGASVFLEGREVGKTPLKLGAVFAQGRYRAWAEIGGVKSVTQQIEIGPDPRELSIDLSFEGALWPAGPGLKPLAQTTIDEEVAKKVGRFVDVDALLLVGIARYDDGEWVYGAAFTVADSTTSRRGALRIDQNTDLSVAARELAGFLYSGSAADKVTGNRVPAQVLPRAGDAPGPAPQAAVADDGATVVIDGSEPAQPPPAVEGPELPWVAIGVGVAVGALVLAGAGVVTGVLIANAPRDGEVTVGVTVLE